MILKELDVELTNLINKFMQDKEKLVKESSSKIYREVLRNIESNVKENAQEIKNGVTQVIGPHYEYVLIKPNDKIANQTNLLENGHKLIQNGQVIGWKDGKYMYQNALNRLKSELEQDAQKLIDEIVGGFND